MATELEARGQGELALLERPRPRPVVTGAWQLMTE